jgi:hypothetical protein
MFRALRIMRLKAHQEIDDAGLGVIEAAATGSDALYRVITYPVD